MKIIAKSIKYDTDGQKVKLPDVIPFIVDDDFDADNELADLISDHTGYCVFGCDFEIVKD
jgi:hypothetical protein